MDKTGMAHEWAKLSYSKDNWEETKEVVWLIGGHCMHENSCRFLASYIYR